jgi:hypothetical protein
MALQPLWPLAAFSSLIYTQSVGRPGRGISQSQGRHLRTEQNKHRINAQISMPRMGFETTNPAFERAKTVHALGRPATVTMGRKTVCTATFQCHNPDGPIVYLPCQRSRCLSCIYYHNSQWGRPSCHAPWQCLWTSSHFRAKPSRLHTRHMGTI